MSRCWASWCTDNALLCTSGIRCRYTVNAGDTLYIPMQYWHWVFSESAVGEPAIAVNVWTRMPHHGACNETGGDRCGNEPQLIKGNALKWPAMKKWTLQQFEAWEAERNSKGDAGKVNADRDSGIDIHGQSGVDMHNPKKGEGEMGTHFPKLVGKGVSLALGTCARSDHIYPEMLRRHTRHPGAPENHVTTFKGLRLALQQLKEAKGRADGMVSIAVGMYAH